MMWRHARSAAHSCGTVGVKTRIASTTGIPKQTRPIRAGKTKMCIRDRLYGMQQDLAGAAQSDSEKTLTGGLLSDLEQISRQAHEAVGFTYAPLEQLAALQ